MCMYMYVHISLIIHFLFVQHTDDKWQVRHCSQYCKYSVEHNSPSTSLSGTYILSALKSDLKALIVLKYKENIF